MGVYQGQTYRVSFMKGGWNANPNVDLLPPEAMIDPININLNYGGRMPRGGTAKVNAVAIEGNPQIMGLFQFRKKNGNTYIITTTADGKIQKDFTTVLKTGLTPNRYSYFEVFNDKLYITNGADRPQVWDGASSSTSDLANVPSDWLNDNWPKVIVKHGRGVSERLWAFGCPKNPEKIYVSANGTDDFSDENVTMLNIETGDGYGIVGMVEFGDRLFAIGKRRAYLIEDTDLNPANWGYTASQWEGGVAHQRLIAKTQNDVIVMSEDGNIYSIVAVNQYGDYQAVSLTREAYINYWIENNIDLSQIDKFHMVYDPTLRAIKIFSVLKGKSRIDNALVLFVDRGASDGWVRHYYSKDTFCSVSSVVQKYQRGFKVYCGGYDGYVYELETEARNDDGLYYYAGFKTPHLTFENPRVAKRYDNGWLTIIPQSNEVLKVNLYIDGQAFVNADFLSDEFGNYIGDEIGNMISGGTVTTWGVIAQSVDTSVLKQSLLQDVSYHIGKVGKRIQAEIFVDEINKDFLVSSLMFDFEPLGSELS